MYANMKCTCKNIFYLILLLCSIVGCWTDEGADGVLDLEGMSNEELEDICIQRGFELVKEKDDDTGELKSYSHEDYVNAAKQCLQIESEMEEVLTKHPELLKDIESEAEKMREEKLRLEKELDELQNKDEISGEATEGSSRNSQSNSETKEEEDTDDKFESETAVRTQEGDDDIIDLDEVDDEANSSNEEKESESKGTIDENNENPATSLAGKNHNVTVDIWEEFKTQVRKDLNRVFDLFLPKQIRGPLVKALEPVITVTEGAVKTIIDMVHRYSPARKFDEKSSQGEIKKTEVASD